MESINNKVSTMWKNENFYNSYYLNYEFADFYTWAKVLWLWFKWTETLNSINNPYLKKYNNIGSELLEKEDYSILFIIFSKVDEKSFNLLKDNILKLQKSHDLLIWIILDESSESIYDDMFNTYFFSNSKDINLIIDWILSSVILPWLFCLDLTDIFSFFWNAWKLNYYIASSKWEEKVNEIMSELNYKYTNDTTKQYITIFISTAVTMMDTDEVALRVAKNDDNTDLFFSSPIIEVLTEDEICCVLFSN